MKKIFNNLLLVVIFLVSFASYSLAENLYTIRHGVDFGYRYMDARRYNSHNITLNGSHRLGTHGFSYDFAQIWGTESLTKIGASYSYKNNGHWFGLGVSSASDKPFTQFNLIDFNVFYAYRLFQTTIRYTDRENGDRIPHYSRLYLGIDWSTDRILLDGYPLPVIRYEYDGPHFYLILGFPMTYINIYAAPNHSIELKYIPVTNILLSYNVEFLDINTLSFQFEVENKMYRKSGGDKWVFFFAQQKYYTEYYWLRLKYTLSVANNFVKISPYAAFLIDGKRYYGKNFFDDKNKVSTGSGFAVGINLSLKF